MDEAITSCRSWLIIISCVSAKDMMDVLLCQLAALATRVPEERRAIPRISRAVGSAQLSPKGDLDSEK
jgi:hypothetical protein